MNVMKSDQEGTNAGYYMLLGARLDALSDRDVVDLMKETIDHGESRIIGHHNMHSLYLMHHDPKMREFYACADHIYIDGMALILLGRVLGLPLRQEDSATYLEFLPLLASEAARQQWRIFFLGAQVGVADAAAAKLRMRYPGIQFQTHHGHFNMQRGSEDNQRVLEAIKAYSPHIVMVGMGMPRQEEWVVENRGDITANIISTTGAIMDYVAGVKAAAPRWLRPLYMEWYYRLLTEPVRLWRRYLVEPWFVLGLIIRWHSLHARGATTTDFTNDD
jgi:N-acetylglucosaminyldiphosphoundecaprenol N-acetyl-beta-D-mannosaminyltransferase